MSHFVHGPLFRNMRDNAFFKAISDILSCRHLITATAEGFAVHFISTLYEGLVRSCKDSPSAMEGSSLGEALYRACYAEVSVKIAERTCSDERGSVMTDALPRSSLQGADSYYSLHILVGN